MKTYTAGSSTNGSQNIFLGTAAGDNMSSGNNNIIIGDHIDAPLGTANYQLDIGNIIYGTNIDGSSGFLSTGNIGIGLTTPTFKLDVAGTGRFSSTLKVGAYTLPATDGTSGQVLKTNGAGVLTWQADAGGPFSGWGLTGNAGTNATSNFIGTTDAIDFVIKTNNIENVRVNTFGNVGIGSTSPPAKLTALGAAANPSIPNNASTGIIRIAVSNSEGLDIGKMGSGSFASWLQSGYNGVTADPLALNPVGGNVGISTNAPTAILDVNGTTKIGTLGTILTNIIKSTNNVDVASIAANTSATTTFTVTNAVIGSTVSISPNLALANGLIIAYARVSAANTVEVKFTNVTGSAIDPAIMDYYITVVK